MLHGPALPVTPAVLLTSGDRGRCAPSTPPLCSPSGRALGSGGPPQWGAGQLGRRLVGGVGIVLVQVQPSLLYAFRPERRDELRPNSTGRCCTSTISRSDAEHVLDSSRCAKERRTDPRRVPYKRLVLAVYDAMSEATESRVPFVSPLDPPPGHGPRHPEQPSD